MSEDKIRACFDVLLPAALNDTARQKALEENFANVSPFEAATVNSKLWKTGRTLTVTFLDGIKEVQEKVEYYAHQWEEYANIKFEFTDDPEAIIRISFNYDGSWSALGTDALVEQFFAKDEPTMNYGWLTPDSDEDEFSRVVLHEFGHALGMIHEHTSPAHGIKWNKEAVYASLGGPPNNWDKATIDFNMFERYSTFQTQFTKFDPKSIMLYSFPSEWTFDGMAFETNSILSEKDKTFISARYPK